MGESPAVLSLAQDYWSDIPRCRHHVMARLAAAGHRVLFVGPHLELREALRHGWRTRPVLRPLQRARENLFTYLPPAWAASTYRYPWLDSATGALRLALLRAALARLGMDRPIVYVWHPAFVDIAEELDSRLVVYHCYDQYAAFTGADRALVERQERRLLERADIVFAVSEGLRERLRAFHPRVVLMRNGVDYDRFAAAQSCTTTVPDDIAAIPGPIVGCVTRVVPEYFDAPLLRQIFLPRPDWSLVVIGPEIPYAGQAGLDVSTLKALPNVHFLGARPFEQLPRYLKAMRACVIPYRPTENKLLADPLKLYEYLAAGKPTVCPPLPIDADLRPLVSMATGACEWMARLAEALEENSAVRVADRQAAARSHTWDRRAACVREVIRQHLEE